MWNTQKKQKYKHTFVQPVGKSVEDNSLHPRGGDSQRVTPHIWLVVDVILKDVDLKRKRRGWRYWLYTHTWSHIIILSAVFLTDVFLLVFYFLLSNWALLVRSICFSFWFPLWWDCFFILNLVYLTTQQPCLFTRLLPSVF